MSRLLTNLDLLNQVQAVILGHDANLDEGGRPALNSSLERSNGQRDDGQIPGHRGCAHILAICIEARLRGRSNPMNIDFGLH
ncbi:MAG: hypothetical protein ABWY11_04835 [Umezawaea sp.]